MMKCNTVSQLNALIKSGEIRQQIRVDEALHEKRFSDIAQMISISGAKAVMVAGPSASGKTTSTHRLATHMRLLGKDPVLISLDDYYIDRDMIALGPDGKLDLEHIDTIDTTLFSDHLRKLLSGENVSLPTFDFLTGKRQWHGKNLQLAENSVVIVEGLHALNPVLLPDNLDSRCVFRLYIIPILILQLDADTPIPTSFLRRLRRIVRDHKTRGASVQQTMDMWDSVRRGEKRWIFPFQDKANVVFNSATTYELSVLKKHIYPLLAAVDPKDGCYQEVQSILEILNCIECADVDDEIPPTSLVREFIGDNTFYK